MEIVYGPFISLKQAKAQGLKQYYTGKPCKHAHIAVRSTAKSCCFECDKERKTKKKNELKERGLSKNLLKSIKENTRDIQFGPYPLVYGPFISRKQAKTNSLKHYFDGKPCKHGHIDIRAVSNRAST